MHRTRDSVEAVRRRRLFNDVDVDASDFDQNDKVNYNNLINRKMIVSSPINEYMQKSPFQTNNRESNGNPFSQLKNFANGKISPGGNQYHRKDILSKPQLQFDKIMQDANEYLVEANYAITRLKNKPSTEMDLIDYETQIEKTLKEVTTIAWYLRNSSKETAERRLDSETVVSPRVLESVRSREKCVNELFKSIRETRKRMEEALTVQSRKDLLDEWGPFTDRITRRMQRDAEEITSDSTERLLNSKRILLETVQASAGTLDSLATSSQSVQTNDKELTSQNYMLRTAHNLLKKYGRRASTDKLLIWLAATFFGVCVLMVTYRRLL